MNYNYNVIQNVIQNQMLLIPLCDWIPSLIQPMVNDLAHIHLDAVDQRAKIMNLTMLYCKLYCTVLYELHVYWYSLNYNNSRILYCTV